MKEITVVEPVFFSTFQCIGSDCRDHCCKGWNISLDKKSVNRYLKSPKIEIRNIASESITKLKKSDSKWGEIKLTSSGNCAFIDADSLCKVQKEMGAGALSPVCSTYPRTKIIAKHEVSKSLMLSCPEATRQLLTDPDAMLLREFSIVQPQANNAIDVDSEKKLINLICANLIKSNGGNVNEALYGIASLFMFINKLDVDSEERITRLEDYYFSVLQSLEEGKVRAQLENLPSDASLQWSLLMRLHTHLDSKGGRRGWNMLKHYMKKMLYIQTEGLQAGDNAAAIDRLNAAWESKARPWLASRPHLMSNYLQYRIYNDKFPSYGKRTNLSSLYMLTAEWFMIKMLIAACFEFMEQVSEDDIINIIYSYHSVTKHDEHSTEQIFAEIDKVKVNDDLSLIYLLK